MKRIDPAELIAMNDLAGDFPLRVDLVYAQADHEENIFKTALYKPEAKLWLHRDMANIVCRAAQMIFDQHGYKTLLFDGLRTTEAQAAMRETDIVKAHPQWLEGETRLLSPPGHGGHPRGMAIDLTLETEDWARLDMGTAFDALPSGGAEPRTNKAHRDNMEISDEAAHNRDILTGFMILAAKETGLPLLPLPQEWWDFRFPASYYNEYAPLSDADLPEQMRMAG